MVKFTGNTYFVSQGTVKKFSDKVKSTGIFVTNLVRTFYCKFCQNHASFMRDMTIIFWLTCYCDTY